MFLSINSWASGLFVKKSSSLFPVAKRVSIVCIIQSCDVTHTHACPLWVDRSWKEKKMSGKERRKKRSYARSPTNMHHRRTMCIVTRHTPWCIKVYIRLWNHLYLVVYLIAYALGSLRKHIAAMLWSFVRGTYTIQKVFVRKGAKDIKHLGKRIPTGEEERNAPICYMVKYTSK